MGGLLSPGCRARRPRAPPFIDPPGHARHRPEATLLYQLVEQHYPAFRELRAEAGRPLPDYVQAEFGAYPKCGRLEEGCLRVRCDACRAEKLVAFSCKRRGFCPSCGARRMAETAALLADEVLPERPQRQWVLSLPHGLRFLLARNPAALTRVLGVVYGTISGFLLFLDGAYRTGGRAAPTFRPVCESGAQALVEQIALRTGRTLEQRGLIERDLENAWLAADREAGPLDDLIGHSITYRIAVGPRAGEKLFTLQRPPGRPPPPENGDPHGATRADASDPRPRGIRAAQPAAGRGDAGRPRAVPAAGRPRGPR